jgi:hypothetical protein
MCIIFPSRGAAQAFHGLSVPGHALWPRRLKNGDYALPARVLDDPAHLSRHSGLQGFPQRDVSLNEWATDENPDLDFPAP